MGALNGTSAVQELAIDVVRVGHLLAFAIGFGAALFLEISVLQRFQSRIDRSDLALLNQGHTLILSLIHI